MKSVPTEHIEQVTLVQWLERQHPNISKLLFAVPNGASLAGPAHARAKQMQRLKAEGLRNGTPDIFIAYPYGGYHGLFIEMKRQKGGTLSKEQKQWLERLNEQGYLAKRCNGWEAAKEVIECYLNGTI